MLNTAARLMARLTTFYHSSTIINNCTSWFNSSLSSHSLKVSCPGPLSPNLILNCSKISEGSQSPIFLLSFSILLKPLSVSFSLLESFFFSFGSCTWSATERSRAVSGEIKKHNSARRQQGRRFWKQSRVQN